MTTRDKALKKAQECLEGVINHCDETEKYWIFSDTNAIPSFGGCSSPVAIEKKTGKPLYNYTLCCIHHMVEDSDVLKEYDIENGVFIEK